MSHQKKSRSELKSLFARDAIPEEDRFGVLIDSMVNQLDDGISASDHTALRLKAPVALSAAASAPAAAAATSIEGQLNVNGPIFCGSSELVLSDPEHELSSSFDFTGWTYLQNAKDSDTLIVAGRRREDGRRHVRISDDVDVLGDLTVGRSLAITGAIDARDHLSVGNGLSVQGGPIQLVPAGGSVRVEGGVQVRDQLQAESLTLTGNAVMNQLSLSGALHVDGNATFAGGVLAQAWGNMTIENGAISVQGSYNLATPTFNGGKLQVNFARPQPNNRYTAVVSAFHTYGCVPLVTSASTTQFFIAFFGIDDVRQLIDPSKAQGDIYVNLVVFGT